MDQKQHLLSDDDATFSDDAHGPIETTSDGDHYHSCCTSRLRYRLPRLHPWTYMYFLTLHLALALTLIILTTKIVSFAPKTHMDGTSYCKLSDNKKSSLTKGQPL